MHDWMFEPGPDPLSLTLADQPGSPDPGTADWFSHASADDFETWLFETQPKGDLDGVGPMFIEGEGGGDDDGAHEIDEVVVTGSRIERLPTAVQITIGDVGETPIGEIGGGGVQGDDECPWQEFYRDAAAQVGLLAGVLGALKDSPFTFDPRDDRAIDRALFALDSLDVMLQSQTLDYNTLLSTVSSAIEIILSEGTDHFAIVIGALAGGAVAGIFDGPIPAGEIVGGIGGAVTVYLAGDRLPTAQIAQQLARLILANVEIPPDTPGRRCS